MDGDLLVIAPSRARPGNIGRLLEAVHATSKLMTHVHVAVDEDDPQLETYRSVIARAGADGDVLEAGPRKGLAAWTNEIAVRCAAGYPYLASLGDDMVPRTKGWDRALVRAIEDMGGTGFAYPWDGTREDIPECVVLSSDVVAALRWMCEPSLSHWWVDNVWADLGRGADCLRYCRAVAVDHVHPSAGLAAPDATYRESGTKIAADRDAYYRWRAERMAADITTVAGLRERRLQIA